jgi:hypothetical protein
MEHLIHKADELAETKQWIIHAVARWKRKHSQEWSLFQRDLAELRSSLYKSSGIDFEGTHQRVARVPSGLLKQLDALNGNVNITNNENLWKWFKHSFPEFIVTKK